MENEEYIRLVCRKLPTLKFGWIILASGSKDISACVMCVAVWLLAMSSASRHACPNGFKLYPWGSEIQAFGPKWSLHERHAQTLNPQRLNLQMSYSLNS